MGFNRIGWVVHTSSHQKQIAALRTFRGILHVNRVTCKVIPTTRHKDQHPKPDYFFSDGDREYINPVQQGAVLVRRLERSLKESIIKLYRTYMMIGACAVFMPSS